MEIWWLALPNSEKILWSLAIFSLTLLILKTTLTFKGGDNENIDIEDSEGHTVSQYFTIRNMISFLTGFSWGTLSALQQGLSMFLSLCVGLCLGIGLVYLTLKLLAELTRLQNSGTLLVENLIGENGEVTLNIPKNESGIGKVLVIGQGRVEEIEAITCGEELHRKQKVRIISITNNNRLLVEQVV